MIIEIVPANRLRPSRRQKARTICFGGESPLMRERCERRQDRQRLARVQQPQPVCTQHPATR
jgi:hypothetical protein